MSKIKGFSAFQVSMMMDVIAKQPDSVTAEVYAEWLDSVGYLRDSSHSGALDSPRSSSSSGKGTRGARRQDVAATESQRRFIDSLLLDRDVTGAMDQAEIADLITKFRENLLTKSEARALITHLKALPFRSAAPEAPATAQSAEEITEGMYRTSNDSIFKVQQSQTTGRLYAKKLVQDERNGWSFEYAPGALRSLTLADKMSLEEAGEFGRLYGVCCVCSRTLTDEKSIAAGIGPVCAGRF